jgi:transposase-like protein
MKRTYSQEEKDKALAMYVESGLAEAVRQTGIPKGTIESWARRSGLQTFAVEKTRAATETMEAKIAATRAHLKWRLIARAVELEARMDEPHIDFKSAGPLGPMEVTFPKATAQGCQQYATAIGILIDKFRLESGEVTGREEVKHGFDFGHLSDDELERKTREVLSEAESITGGVLP